MLLCTAKEMFVKQTTFKNILRTEVSSKLFYSLTIVFFPTNSLDKASKLIFIFICIYWGYIVSHGQTTFSRHGTYRLHYKRLSKKGLVTIKFTARSGLICLRHLDLRKSASMPPVSCTGVTTFGAGTPYSCCSQIVVYKNMQVTRTRCQFGCHQALY